MIYIGIGSNLGNRISNIEKAKYLLNLNGVKIVKKSNYYESLSWPDPTKPKFINIVVKSNSNFSPKKLIKIFQLIEKKLGRKKSIKRSIPTGPNQLSSNCSHCGKKGMLLSPAFPIQG